jgi:ribosome biogenesis GTPase
LNLQKLGFDDWFQKHFNAHESEQFSVARVLQVNKSNYIIGDGEKEIQAELTG